MRKCEITGKKPLVGRRYSNRVRATKFNPTSGVRRVPNIQTKKIFVSEVGKVVKVKATSKAFRDMKKVGTYKTLKKTGIL